VLTVYRRMYRSSCCNASFFMNSKPFLHNALVSSAFRLAVVFCTPLTEVCDAGPFFCTVWSPGIIWTSPGVVWASGCRRSKESRTPGAIWAPGAVWVIPGAVWGPGVALFCLFCIFFCSFEAYLLSLFKILLVRSCAWRSGQRIPGW